MNSDMNSGMNLFGGFCLIHTHTFGAHAIFGALTTCQAVKACMQATMIAVGDFEEAFNDFAARKQILDCLD